MSGPVVIGTVSVPTAGSGGTVTTPLTLLATENLWRGADGTYAGGNVLEIRGQHPPAAWSLGTSLSTDGFRDDARAISTEPRPRYAYRNPCGLHDRRTGTLCAVAVREGRLRFFRRGFGPVPIAAAADVAGNPSGPPSHAGTSALVQGPWGRNGANFELVVPLRSRPGMQHLWAEYPDGFPRAEIEFRPALQFGDRPVEAVNMIHSSYGNLELIALERVDGRAVLSHWFQRGVGGTWVRAAELAGSDQAAGTPGFIQSTYGMEWRRPGNFEVVAPDAGGNLLQWWRNGTSFEWHQIPTFRPPGGSEPFRTTSLVQVGATVVGSGTPAFSTHNDFVVLAETRASIGGAGYGTILEFRRDNVSGRGWSGPVRVEPR